LGYFIDEYGEFSKTIDGRNSKTVDERNSKTTEAHHIILLIMIMSHLQREMSTTKEYLRKSLLTRPTLETIKQGIKSLIIQMFLLITIKLAIIRKVYGIEDHVHFCGLNNHVSSKCQKRMDLYIKVMASKKKP
jgi:hypothetical protein